MFVSGMPAHRVQVRGAGPQRLLVSCRFGGQGEILGGSGAGPKGKPPKLVLPGQGSGAPARNGGSLILPTPGGGPSGGSLQMAGGASEAGIPVMRNFRPPPGFMDGATDAAPAANPSEMLDRIEAGAGHWHQLAKLLPALQRAGFDAAAVEDRTGVDPKTQNLWSSAAQIYDSLAAAGGAAPDILAHYDQEGAEHLLYELRFLSLAQRVATSTYIAQCGLDPKGALQLARAVKEHERRAGHKEGFSDSPGDCLAFKFFRDANECRKPDEVEAYVRKGLKVADTEEAVAKLTSLVETPAEAAAAAAAAPAATLNVLRLTRDEVGCRPVAVVGAYGTARAADVRAGPKVSSEGVFGRFSVPSSGAALEWVPLPAWSILSLAGRPLALTVANCADVPAMHAFLAGKSFTAKDAVKLQGEGVIVIDAAPSEPSLEEDQYYAVEAADGGVELMDGGAAAACQVLGPVLFLVRPPTRDTTGNTTSEILSV